MNLYQLQKDLIYSVNMGRIL